MSYFTEPMLFTEAIKRLAGLKPAKIALSSEQWQSVAEDIRENAFFTANVASADVLSKMKKELSAFMTGAQEQTPRGPKLRIGSKAAFVKRMQGWLIDRGFGDPLPAGAARGGRGIVTESQDLASRRRLALIFETQTQKALAYGSLKFSTDPRIVDAWPAWRFVREGFVSEPRPDHAKHEGDVRLKNDDRYWRARNDPKFGGFGVPYGPWGFNSQMGVEDVTRTEAINLGLIKQDEKVKNPSAPQFNASTKASIKNMDPVIVQKLKNALGDSVEIVNGEIKIKKGNK